MKDDIEFLRNIVEMLHKWPRISGKESLKKRSPWFFITAATLHYSVTVFILDATESHALPFVPLSHSLYAQEQKIAELYHVLLIRSDPEKPTSFGRRQLVRNWPFTWYPRTYTVEGTCETSSLYLTFSSRRCMICRLLKIQNNHRSASPDAISSKMCSLFQLPFSHEKCFFKLIKPFKVRTVWKLMFPKIARARQSIYCLTFSSVYTDNMQ